MGNIFDNAEQRAMAGFFGNSEPAPMRRKKRLQQVQPQRQRQRQIVIVQQPRVRLLKQRKLRKPNGLSYPQRSESQSMRRLIKMGLQKKPAEYYYQEMKRLKAQRELKEYKRGESIKHPSFLEKLKQRITEKKSIYN